MTTINKKTKYVIDATGRSLGRVAAEAAAKLRGKNEATFEPHLLPGIVVEINHAGKIKLASAKSRATFKTHYTGYPGGLRRRSWEQIIAQKGFRELLHSAVRGMLPANKLRPRLLKNLIITE